MKLSELIDKLNDDLSREYAHWHFYVDAAMRVKSLHREEYQELFTKEAEGEMQHILQFGKLIIGLGGIPTRRVAEGYVVNDSTPENFISTAIAMEEEVVKNYVQRMDDAEELEQNGDKDKVHGRYVHIFLEDQILDSRSTVDHFTQLLN